MKQYFAINHHTNATVKNQKFANHLINFLNNKLVAEENDPEIAAILALFVITLLPWNAGYVKWHNEFNFEMGTTHDVEVLTEELIKIKAPEWVVFIWGKYPEGSTRALSLVPHGRQALISGSTQAKVSGIETLLKGLEGDVSMASLTASIEEFLPRYKAAIATQKKSQKALKDFSAAQEVLRLVSTTAMLKVEGLLMAKYFETSKSVDNYFDVEAMRLHNGKAKIKNTVLVALKCSEIKLIDIDYTFKNIWQVTNNGTENASIFFGNTSNIIAIPEYKYTIYPGDTLTINLIMLARDQRFVYAGNLSADTLGDLSIKIMK